MTKARDIASAIPAPSTVSSAELGYLDGVTSAIQTQLNQKPEYVAGKNGVINGAMNVWQRGTSIAVLASTTPYTADRWQVYTNANQATTVSRQATGDTTNLPFIQYAMRYQRNAAQTGVAAQSVAQTLESATLIPLAGKTIGLSFYARAGANYSPASSALIPRIQTGTGSDQNFYTGFTGSVLTSLTAATLTTTWQRFTYSHAVPSTATQIGVDFIMTPVGTAGLNDYFEITGVQMEATSTATPFQTASGTIQGEVALCNRYYLSYTSSDGSLPIGMATGSTTANRYGIALPVPMRTTPSASSSGTLILYDGATTVNITSIATVRAVTSSGNVNAISVDFTVASGLTQYRPYMLLIQSATFILSAEL